MSDRNGFILVSGCPRSGTSLCMDIQRVAHGEDVILGEKFPQEARKVMREEMRERKDDESEYAHNIRSYMMQKQDRHQDLQMSSDEDKWRDMNPEGFWEMAFTVGGIIYHPQYREMLHDVVSGKDTKICKVVSQGLFSSDPMYIGKIIYMLRHPRAVAKSQERLTRGFEIITQDGRKQNIFEDMVIHTPEMFISVTGMAARFLLNNPDIPIHFFHFEELVENPDAVLKEMSDFVGFGDYEKGNSVIQPKLNRSKHEDIPSALWEDAEYVYDEICTVARKYNSGDIEGANPHLEAIIERVMDPRCQFSREKKSWRCYRAKKNVNESICRLCISNPETRGNFLKHSEQEIGKVADHWSQEPCLFECGLDLDRDDYLTLEESVKYNFWSTGVPILKVQYDEGE